MKKIINTADVVVEWDDNGNIIKLGKRGSRNASKIVHDSVAVNMVENLSFLRMEEAEEETETEVVNDTEEEESDFIKKLRGKE
jgi:hypothetical protein